MTETEIANLALNTLGDHGTLVSLATDVSPQANKMRAVFEPRRDALLRSYPWNFAMSRAFLASTYAAISAIVSASGLIKITSSSHGLATNDRVTIKDVVGVPANGTWRVTVVDTNNFTLQLSAFSGTATTLGSWTRAAAFEWAYRHALPADCLRVGAVNGLYASVRDTPFEVEGGFILCNVDEVELRYTKKVTDPSLWDALFVQVFAHDLASVLSIPLAQSMGMRREFEAEKMRLMRAAWESDALESASWVIQQGEDSTINDVRAGILTVV